MRVLLFNQKYIKHHYSLLVLLLNGDLISVGLLVNNYPIEFALIAALLMVFLTRLQPIRGVLAWQIGLHNRIAVKPPFFRYIFHLDGIYTRVNLLFYLSTKRVAC